MMRFEDPEEIRAILPENMTSQQMWTLVKLLKHARGRCRNNAAFNNYMTRMFGDEFEFAEVPKEWQGKRYKGLRITRRGTEDTVEEN